MNRDIEKFAAAIALCRIAMRLSLLSSTPLFGCRLPGFAQCRERGRGPFGSVSPAVVARQGRRHSLCDFHCDLGLDLIVIRGQLGVVPATMVRHLSLFDCGLGDGSVVFVEAGKFCDLVVERSFRALFLGLMQFCVNFNAVYLAERQITSGVVATVFALLVIPSSLLAWAFLGQRPNRRFALSSLTSRSSGYLLCP